MKFTAKVIKDLDRAEFDRLLKRFGAENKAVNVGFPAGIEHKDDSGAATPYTVAQIAGVHEFGSPAAGIPERSFVRSALAENRQSYIALNRKTLARVVNGDMSIAEALGLLGTKAVGDVQRKIRGGPFEELQAATVRRKGSSKPLIDTGQMRQSVQWTLVKEGEE